MWALKSGMGWDLGTEIRGGQGFGHRKQGFGHRNQGWAGIWAQKSEVGKDLSK